MNVDEIRERFLKYFEERGCVRHPSDSLIPANDPSLLFTGAGMNQFKDMFLGRGSLPFKRATTSQKCLRTGDLDLVGRTSGHQTFFEMLGHFSFGDYFKAEAIPWTWEFYTKELGISPEKITISVYKDDDEAYDIWLNSVGIPPDRILRLDEDEAFWPASAPSKGPNGPCGPCSELHYDFGPKYGCGMAGCDVTCSCNRYVEIGNIVFTQFDRKEGGVLDPLPQKNIDFGGGLERVAAILQGVHSNFETDLFQEIIRDVSHRLGIAYEPGTEASSRIRRIADHVRALAFCIADGALPSNEGRGYVVRRILRTALRDGIKLGHEKAFLHLLVPTVIRVMKNAYPALEERAATITMTLQSEEEGFLQTLEKGEIALRERIADRKELSGEDAFLLYDSYGFHIELIEDLCHENGARVDRKKFEALLKEKRAGKSGAFSGAIFEEGPFSTIKERREPVTEFLGHTVPVAKLGVPEEATVRQIIRLDDGGLEAYAKSKKDTIAFVRLLNSGELAESAGEGPLAVLLNRTPFYGESGGQVGDSGTLSGDAEVRVDDCKRPDGYFFHLGEVTGGILKVGDKVTATIDATRRLAIMRNHTGTHILQAALRAVLGPNAEQAGSIVEPHRLRFDFTHPKALSAEQIRQTEDWCNDLILRDLPVNKEEMSMPEAKQRGAIAFFGEKYGDRVRVVTVGDGKSVELCGGTHLERTGTIGQVRITAESSVQRGVRRVEGVTGAGAIEFARGKEVSLNEIAGTLGCPPVDAKKKASTLVKSVQDLKQEVARLRRSGGDGVDELVGRAKEIGGEKILAERFANRKVNDLRTLMDTLIKKKNIAAAILASEGERPAFVIGVREDLVKSKGLKAGDLAREIGKKCGGGGGGRELQAQAGASGNDLIPAGFTLFEELVQSKLKSD
jgi:alanyl-tRNA synthetase